MRQPPGTRLARVLIDDVTIAGTGVYDGDYPASVSVKSATTFKFGLAYVSDTSGGTWTWCAGLLANAIDKLNGASVSVEDTQNQFLDTMDQLTASVKTNGKSIDQNSSKGRANREVLGSLIKAASAHAQAVADQTAKTKGLAAGVEAGTSDFKTHEKAIRKAAAAAGLDKDQVDALIRSLGKVPKNVAPTINIHDKASSQLKTIRQNIAALKSKQIDITTYIKNVILPTVRTPSGSHDSRIRDAGGPVNAGEPYLIGLNRKPELFVPEQSGTVYPLSGNGSGPSGGGGDIYVTVNVLNGDPRATVRELEQWAGRGGKIRIAGAVT